MLHGVFQVGHRDLEDILKDIDLNGDGRVDFEGNNCAFITSKLFTADFQFLSFFKKMTHIDSLSHIDNLYFIIKPLLL